MTANDPGYVFKQITRAISNIDRRLRIVENREVPAGGGGGPTPPEPTTPVTPTLPAGWANAAPYQAISYWKDSSNATQLQGTAALAGVTLPATLFTLPTGFRPLAQLTFSVPTYGIVDVQADGQVRVREAVGFVSLDGISFLAS